MMLGRVWNGALVAVFLAACDEPITRECGVFQEVYVWEDADGDGFGSDVAISYVCKPGENQATNNADCDDEDATVFPGAEEVCDDKDNDCDQFADEAQPKLTYYEDADGDGFGSRTERITACTAPPGFIEVTGDCEDDLPDINPAAREVCDGIDNDCDSNVDDQDASVDPTTAVRYFFDVDLDGFGDSELFVDQCDPPNNGVTVGGDCNDGQAAINPGAQELCNQRDDDCDELTDDDDDSILQSDQFEYFADLDADGFGDGANPQYTCVPGNVGNLDGSDCDDTDPEVHEVQDWLRDNDGDGFGGGAPIATQCNNPGGGLQPESDGVDCNDAQASTFPGADEICADGIDQDCLLGDQCETCLEWMNEDPGAPSGIYTIEPREDEVVEVYCDMTTDGGGWTLVASTLGTTLNDQRGDHHTDLATLFPAAAHPAVWDGLRDVTGAGGDIRFTCKKNAMAAAMDVDLSFYDILWYFEITTGTDTQSCFNENNGVGDDPPPARRNNRDGTFLAAGDAWGSGFLEGEDSCGDNMDFTVDFDERGMAGNSFDGTDWGESNGTEKCGDNVGASWFIFARE